MSPALPLRIAACGAALVLGVRPADAVAADQAALARAADAKLAFGRTYQGRWTCAGTAASGRRLRAKMLLFTDTPGIHNFQVAFAPAPGAPPEPDISEVWTWRWMYGDVGSWYATPSPHSPGAGFLYTSDGPRAGALVWKEHVADSTATRTFEPGGATLRFAVHDHTIRGDDASYALRCTRVKTP